MKEGTSYEGVIENELIWKPDPSSRRGLQEKDQGRTSLVTTVHEEKDRLIPGEGLRLPVGGDESNFSPETSKFARCLPTGCSDEHPPFTFLTSTTNHDRIKTSTIQEAQDKTTEDPTSPKAQRKLIRINRPKQFKADGKSYLRCSPMTAKFRLGSETNPVEMGLTDLYSNTGIISRATLEKYYPNETINPCINNITGVGSRQTIGWVVVPVFIDCSNEKNEQLCVSMDAELYVVERFSVPLLLGLDFFMDYGIEISIRHREASISIAGVGECKFPLFSSPSTKYKDVIVKSSERVIIPGQCVQVISIKAPMAPGIDYSFTPTLTIPRSLPALPQLTYNLISSRNSYIRFTNQTEHPIEILAGQRLGEASAVLFGSQVVETGLHIDWADLIRPNPMRAHKVRCSTGTAPPKSVSTSYHEDMLSFNSSDKENSRPPRSISEADVNQIAKAAPLREFGELFTTEKDEEDTPIPPMPAGDVWEELTVCPLLNERERKELKDLIDEFPDVFSLGNQIGRVIGTKATIDTIAPLPPPQPNRPVGPGKRKIIDETTDQLLQWDVVEESNSPTCSQVVLIWQNGKWRFCVDFRDINAVTKGDSYPMLRADYVFAALANKKYFSLLDAIKGYHQLEIDEKDRYKTAFISHRGLYQYKRLPFGLKNAPAQFQRMMDAVLGSLRWVAALVYIDDVLVYSESWPEHLAHLRTLCMASRKAGLKFSLEKCRFRFNELLLLGYNISRYGLNTVEEKVKIIMDLAFPKSMGELHRLVGMFGHYRGFIRNFAKVAKPLNDLKRGGELGTGTSPYNSRAKIPWNQEAQDAFDELKLRLSSAPILAHPLFDGRPFILYTDASQEAFAAVLCQLWTWEDYENIESDSESEESSPQSFATLQTDLPSWKEEYLADPTFRKMYTKLTGTPGNAAETDEKFSISDDGSMRYQTVRGQRICLPSSPIADILRVSHDVLGHFGIEKTYDRIVSTYYRPGLSEIVTSYIRHCPACIKNKTSRKKTDGSLLPIDIPKENDRIPEAFESINLDLIVGLPKSEGKYDAVLVMIDRFTRTGIFVPTTSNFTAAIIADIFMKRVVSRGFLPTKFITDRDPRLIQSFWQTLCARLGIDHRKTAAFHAQTDGAAERLNQTLEAALHAYVAPRQNDWSKYLHMMELAYNTARNVTTGFAPYKLLYAQPQNPVHRILTSGLPNLDDINENYAASDLLEATLVRLKDAQQAIVKATEAYKRFYDGRHSPMHPYKVGDYASIRLDKHPVAIIKRNKLSQQKLPPYKVIRIVSQGRALELDIPPSLGIHPVVSIQHVEHVPRPSDDPFGRTPQSETVLTSKTAQPNPVNAQIIDNRRTKGGKQKYKIHWTGQEMETDEWVLSIKIDERLVAEYEESQRAQKAHLTMSFLADSPLRKVDHPFKTVRPKPGHPIERPILYISRGTKPYEKSYEATELELSCANWAVTRLRQYLEGSKFTLFSDHEPLKKVLHSSVGTVYSLRIDKYQMLLMPFMDSMTILWKPGLTLTNVDPLSRAKFISDEKSTGPSTELSVVSNGGKIGGS